MGLLDQFAGARGDDMESSGLLASKDVQSGERAEILGLTIAEVDRGRVPAVVLHAERWTKTLVLNRKNGRILSHWVGTLGGNEESLRGKTVVLQLTDSQFNGQPVKSITLVPQV